MAPMKVPARFQTRRLVLRRPRLGDAPAIFATYASDPLVTRYLIWPTHRHVRETRAFLAQARRSWDKGSEHIWLMTLRNGTVVGSIGLRLDGPKAEIGYVLGRGYWGRGLTTEAGRALVAWARQQKSIQRIWGTCDIDNRASARVLEKLGMRREGILRKWLVRPQLNNAPRDCGCYSLVDDD